MKMRKLLHAKFKLASRRALTVDLELSIIELAQKLRLSQIGEMRDPLHGCGL
jgi:hypothetical protein